MAGRILCFDDRAAFARGAAGRIRDAAVAAVRERGLFSLVLSGGSTPAPVYEALATPDLDPAMPWRGVHLFLGDERAVPEGHAWSNLQMARETLVSRIPVPEAQVHPMPAWETPLDAAAQAYEDDLRVFFPPQGGSFPCFDLILLGLGSDGHTASLFPGSPALHESRRWATAAPAPDMEPRVPRLTLTLPVLNAARAVWFLVSGAAKADLARRIAAMDPDPAVPASLVRPGGELLWLVGEA